MKYAGMGVFMVFAVMAGMVMCGCEDGDDDTTALIVEPAVYDFTTTNTTTVTVTNDTGTNVVTTVEADQLAVFTVSETNGGLRSLSFPLVWGVSDSSLGRITSSSGSSAVYATEAKSGVNVVTVRDQYGAQGSATVRQ